MYQIARKIRYVSRWLGIIAVGIVFAAAAFGAALPFIIDGKSVRESFVRSLSTWSGGPVVISGPLRIASFANFSVEASGVSLPSTPRLNPISRAKAQSVTAIAKLSSLLRGKLEFKKFVVASPRFVFRRDLGAPRTSLFGFETAAMALALADRSPFADLELLDPVFLSAKSARKPFNRLALDRVRLGRGGPPYLSLNTLRATVPGADFVSISVKDKGFEATFRGDRNGVDDTALGYLRLTAPLDNPVAAGMLASMAPWERAKSISIGGDLNWSKGRVAIDNATILFGDHSAKGSLALGVAGSRALLEGTIAYDTLDLTPAWVPAAETGASEMRPLSALMFASRDKDRPIDFDMRISAERFRAGSLETGPLALALTATQDRLSLDIAEMALLGGNATGRIDINPSQPTLLSLRGSGSWLDPGPLASALQLPFGVSGPAMVQVRLTMPLSVTSPIPELAAAAAGTFSVRFPSGGSLEGDIPKMLSAALAHQDLDWGLGGTSFPFAAASIDGTVQPGGVDLKVEGERGDRSIGGRLRVAFPGAAVSGTLSASQNPNAPDTTDFPTAPVHSAGSTQLVLSGTAEALIFSPPGKPSLSN